MRGEEEGEGVLEGFSVGCVGCVRGGGCRGGGCTSCPGCVRKTVGGRGRERKHQLALPCTCVAV